MDIEKLKAEFEQSECFKRLEHVAQYTFFEFGAYIKRTDVPADIEKKCGKLITALLFSWSAWKEAKAQAVPEWKDYEFEKPEDGQKCLVVFESMDAGDSHRWMCIDEFNEGMFDFIANWEDECASVALPAGSVISKVRAVCWAKTNLSNSPLSFDQFYKTQEQAND